ncbi:MAG: aminotransferase class IV [Actinomycetales bacterium]|nr:aminotransferase class IV [Actinomycetales bacterium]
MDFGTFFQFVDGELIQVAELADVDLVAADSWLVEDAAVRNQEKHFERFRKAALSQPSSPSNETLDAFFAAVIAQVPTAGRWFPRIEFHAEKAEPLFLKLREAPAQLGDAALWTLDEPDPRATPTIKGPDLSLCMQLRRKAQVHGADEAVLLNESGNIVEGALSSIVWWQGNVLCAPDDSTEWLDSVTRHEIFETANQLGLETRFVSAKPTDLVDCEIWVLSSLQGIRRVNNWLHGDAEIELAAPTAESLRRLESFRLRLKMLSTRP